MNAPPAVPPVFQAETSELPPKKHPWLKAFIIAEFVLSGSAFLSIPQWAKVMADLGLKSDDLPGPAMFLIAVHNAMSNLIGPLYILLGALAMITLAVFLGIGLNQARLSKLSLIVGILLMFGVLLATTLPIAMPFVKVETSLSHGGDEGK